MDGFSGPLRGGRGDERLEGRLKGPPLVPQLVLQDLEGLLSIKGAGEGRDGRDVELSN